MDHLDEQPTHHSWNGIRDAPHEPSVDPIPQHGIQPDKLHHFLDLVEPVDLTDLAETISIE